MADVLVQGKVVYKKDMPGKDGRPPQVMVSVQDGERFAFFVPLAHELARLEVGEFVEVSGVLQVRRYDGGVNLNISEVESWQRLQVVPLAAAE